MKISIFQYLERCNSALHNPRIQDNDKPWKEMEGGHNAIGVFWARETYETHLNIRNMHISNYLKIHIQVRNNIELQISLTGLIILFKNIINMLAVTRIASLEADHGHNKSLHMTQ